MSPGLTSYLDVYIKTSKYGQDRLTARFTRFARAQDLVAAPAASRIRHHGCHRQYIRRSAARRGGLALPRAVSDGGSGLDSRGADQKIRVAGCVESLLADTNFGWRQLYRNKVTSAAAVLSLALGMGSCVAAFRLIDALLWRPLPIANADRLYLLSRSMTGLEGTPVTSDYSATPAFKVMRDDVKDQADLIAISEADRTDITWSTDDDMEKTPVVSVSGNMFPLFGLYPPPRRLLPPPAHSPPPTPYSFL